MLLDSPVNQSPVLLCTLLASFQLLGKDLPEELLLWLVSCFSCEHQPGHPAKIHWHKSRNGCRFVIYSPNLLHAVHIAKAARSWLAVELGPSQ